MDIVCRQIQNMVSHCTFKYLMGIFIIFFDILPVLNVSHNYASLICSFLSIIMKSDCKICFLNFWKLHQLKSLKKKMPWWLRASYLYLSFQNYHLKLCPRKKDEVFYCLKTMNHSKNHSNLGRKQFYGNGVVAPQVKPLFEAPASLTAVLALI